MKDLEAAARWQTTAGNRLRSATEAAMATPTSSARVVRNEAYREWQDARSAYALAIRAEQAAVAEIDAKMGVRPRWEERWREALVR